MNSGAHHPKSPTLSMHFSLITSNIHSHSDSSCIMVGDVGFCLELADFDSCTKGLASKREVLCFMNNESSSLYAPSAAPSSSVSS